MVLFASKEANMVRYPYEYMAAGMDNSKEFDKLFVFLDQEGEKHGKGT